MPRMQKVAKACEFTFYNHAAFGLSDRDHAEYNTTSYK